MVRAGNLDGATNLLSLSLFSRLIAVKPADGNEHASGSGDPEPAVAQVGAGALDALERAARLLGDFSDWHGAEAARASYQPSVGSSCAMTTWPAAIASQLGGSSLLDGDAESDDLPAAAACANAGSPGEAPPAAATSL